MMVVCWGVPLLSWRSVAPVRRAAIVGLVDLGLLLHGAGLAPLAWPSLSVLGEVMVEQLRVGLLVSRQNVKEWSRSITWGSSRGQRSCATKSRREVERWRCASMETLLLERLCFIVNSSTDVWHPRIARCHRDTFPWARGSRFGLCLRGVTIAFAVIGSCWALRQVIIP